MKATELRIGNLVQSITHKTNIEINLIDGYKKYDYYEPIPLTEEWLLKFGFQMARPKSGILKAYKLGMVRIEISNSLNFYYKRRVLNGIHDLQNLYFVLTGEELTIK